MNRFAFVLHPLTARDMAAKYKAVRLLPEFMIQALLRFVPIESIGHITGVQSTTGAVTEGWFIGCPLTAGQLMNGDPERGIDKIVQCGRVAEDLGAEILGLGAFTSIVGDAGITVAERLDIAVTTGNSYTVAAALEGAVDAAKLLGHDPAACTATILGATGSIGRAAAKILAPTVGKLVLNARTEAPLEELSEEIGSGGAAVIAETDISVALRDAQIVIAVTSALDAVVRPEMLVSGAVVCDVARPRDVSTQVAEHRPDVLVIEGGAILVPGDVDFGFDFGFPPNEAYACMAETMILALEGRCEDYSLGREIRVEQVAETSTLARKHGFRLAGFRSFEQKVTEADIERVRGYVRRA